jgi:hypothetical protein
MIGDSSESQLKAASTNLLRFKTLCRIENMAHARWRFVASLC